MSRTLSRVAGGALAILTAATISNVAIARAQTAPTTGVPAVSTDCGSGTIQQCSTEKTFKCEWSFSLSYVPGTYLPIISVSSSNCVESGERPIYKDKYPTTTSGGGCVVSRYGTDEEEETCL